MTANNNGTATYNASMAKVTGFAPAGNIFVSATALEICCTLPLFQ